MKDDDRLIEGLPKEFGSGVIGVCDICGVRQAVVILEKERYQLCVLDFLNKTWTQTDRPPGAPLPPYRSERIWFDTGAFSGRPAPAIVLSPTKVVRRPVALVVPDVYGLTTPVLDAGIRLAREGFEVLLPDLGKTDGVSPRHHLALRAGARLSSGVSARAKPIRELLELFTDALTYLVNRPMVDSAKVGVIGLGYGATLAGLLAVQDPRPKALALADPAPWNPPGIPALLSIPVLLLRGERDRLGRRAQQQFEAAGTGSTAPGRVLIVPGARPGFLARDRRSYDVARAEAAWSKLIGFLKSELIPPPPRPPPIPNVINAGTVGSSGAATRPAAPIPSVAAATTPSNAGRGGSPAPS